MWSDWGTQTEKSYRFQGCLAQGWGLGGVWYCVRDWAWLRLEVAAEHSTVGGGALTLASRERGKGRIWGKRFTLPSERYTAIFSPLTRFRLAFTHVAAAPPPSVPGEGDPCGGPRGKAAGCEAVAAAAPHRLSDNQMVDGPLGLGTDGRAGWDAHRLSPRPSPPRLGCSPRLATQSPPH